MLSPMTAHVDEALTNISVAYTGPAHVDEQIFPVVPVDKQSDLFFKFSKQDFFADLDALTPGADANDIEIDLDARGYYFADGHGYNYMIPDALMANADSGAELDIEFTKKITEKISLRKEVNLAGLINTTNITQNQTPTAPNKWSDYENSDPILAVETQKETIQQATGLSPQDYRLLINRPVFRTIRNHPRIIERIKYVQKGNPLTLDQLAEAFEIKEVVLAESLQQTAAYRGRADALSYVWGNNALLYYRPEQPGKRTAALGYTFVWIQRGSGGPEGLDMRASGKGGLLVKRWRVEGRDQTGLGIRFYYTQQFIDTNCGYLFNSVI